MTQDEPSRSRLDILTQRAVERLRAIDLGERERLLDEFERLPRRDVIPVEPRRAWKRALAWTASAACIAAMVAAIPLLLPMSAQTVYGIEALPRQLLAVHTVRQRGWHRLYDSRNPQAPPIQVPIDTLVKRPNQYRFRWYGSSESKDGLKVRTGEQICNGQQVMYIQDQDRKCVTKPIHPVTARLMTEMFAQGQLMSTLLGPADASYRQVRKEVVAGRPCDVYEARFKDDDETSLVTVWFDPLRGLPVMQAYDEVLFDGTLRRVMQLDNIELNEPLDDALFQPPLPEGYDVAESAAATTPPPFSLQYTSAGYSSEEKLEAWHTLRISESAALLFWRRNPPQPRADGTRDWLSDMTLGLHDSTAHLAHDWIVRATSADDWIWLLVVVPDGGLPERATIDMTLKRPKCQHSLAMLPLVFGDEELRQILAAAQSTLPADAPRPSLEELRERAAALAKVRQ